MFPVFSPTPVLSQKCPSQLALITMETSGRFNVTSPTAVTTVILRDAAGIRYFGPSTSLLVILYIWVHLDSDFFLLRPSTCLWSLINCFSPLSNPSSPPMDHPGTSAADFSCCLSRVARGNDRYARGKQAFVFPRTMTDWGPCGRESWEPWRRRAGSFLQSRAVKAADNSSAGRNGRSSPHQNYILSTLMAAARAVRPLMAGLCRLIDGESCMIEVVLPYSCEGLVFNKPGSDAHKPNHEIPQIRVAPGRSDGSPGSINQFPPKLAREYSGDLASDSCGVILRPPRARFPRWNIATATGTSCCLSARRPSKQSAIKPPLAGPMEAIVSILTCRYRLAPALTARVHVGRENLPRL
ncbi:hypothetical protein Bbelb_203190 [Branchiostoma belcheri]|nr:hypothetical protein Bbelb_203190 [Branchiostoma belcheri]